MLVILSLFIRDTKIFNLVLRVSWDSEEEEEALTLWNEASILSSLVPPANAGPLS